MIIKIRKISLYTGLGLNKWQIMPNIETAKKFIQSNQSVTGSFYWILKTSK